MNNSLVKLEDFQLDEISGGITAKQVSKKAGAYAIKGTLSVAFGVTSAAFGCFFVRDPIGRVCAKKYGVEYKDGVFILEVDNINDNIKIIDRCVNNATMIGLVICGTGASLTAVGGWKLGEWICKKNWPRRLI